MKSGGQILSNAIAICDMSKISWQTGKLRMNEDLENPFKARSFHLVQRWSLSQTPRERESENSSVRVHTAGTRESFTPTPTRTPSAKDDKSFSGSSADFRKALSSLNSRTDSSSDSLFLGCSPLFWDSWYISSLKSPSPLPNGQLSILPQASFAKRYVKWREVPDQVPDRSECAVDWARTAWHHRVVLWFLTRCLSSAEVPRLSNLILLVLVPVRLLTGTQFLPLVVSLLPLGRAPPPVLPRRQVRLCSLSETSLPKLGWEHLRDKVRTDREELGYLADPTHSTSYQPKQTDKTTSVDGHDNISDFSNTTCENTGLFGAPTVCETSVSHGFHGNVALQRESKESMPRETVARQREREEREGFVVSVAESMSKKSRRNSTRSHSLQTHKEFYSNERDHREHLERRAQQATLGENSVQRKLYSTEYNMEIQNLERRNSEYAVIESQRELESQRLQ